MVDESQSGNVAGRGWRAALYYPYFHVRDQRRWLKVAALYWPMLLRLVPDGFTTHDTDEVRALVDAGFLRSRPPGRTAEAVAADFLEVLGAHEAELRQRYTVERPTGWPGPAQSVAPLDSAGSGRSVRIDGVHSDMLAAPLTDALLRAGLASPRLELIGTGQNNAHHGVAPDHTWLAMRQEVVRVYSGVLAERFCRDQSDLVQPVTDQPDAYVAGGADDADGIARALLGHGSDEPAGTATTTSQTIALLALNLVVPGRLDEVPIAHIVWIRTHYRDELDAFGTAVTETATNLADEIAGVEDPVVLAHYLAHIVDERFAGPLRDLRAALRGLTWGSATMAVDAKTVLPAGVATVVPSLAGQPVVGAAAGTALALVSAGQAYAQQRRAALSGRPEISFLLHARHRLGRRRMLERLAARFRT